MSEWEKTVRKALIDHDMTVSDLAGQMGISVSYCFELIRGTRQSESYKNQIIQILGI